jgi:4-amino-4-deoxy-L-arabinose transferase-like glycosyltransferase
MRNESESVSVLQPKWVTARHFLVIILLGYIFFFHGIGDYSLKEPDEGRYAEIPREMVESGTYLVPYLNYVRYFEKPPLFYWAAALSYKVFGVSEWSVRFPNALSGFLCVVLLYWMSRRWFGEHIAFLSSLILMSSLGFFAMGRIVTLDMVFTLCLFATVLFFYDFYREKKAHSIYLAYAFLGLSTLAKGPVALVLFGATALIFLWTDGNVSFLKQMKLIPGLALYAIITVPWFLMVSLREREFFNFFFVDQHFLRFFTTKHKRSGPILYFFPVLFGGMFPWSFLLPRAVIDLWKNREVRLFLIWSIVVFVFFSLSGSKLPPYILPAFPALSLLLGFFFKERWDKSLARLSEIIAYLLFFGTLALSAGLAIGGIFHSYIANFSADGQEIFRELRGFSIAILLTSAAAFCLLLVKRFRRFSSFFYPLVGFSVILMLLLILNFGFVDRLNTTKHLTNIIKKNNIQADYIVDYGSFEETLPFYTGRKIFMASYSGELEMGSQYPDARDSFLTEDQFFGLWGSHRKVLCVAKVKRLDRLASVVPGRARILGCQSGRCLITNH